MGENLKIFPLRPNPGIKRDGTSTEGNFWGAGIWTRFYRGLPRSILGYRDMTDTYPGPSRGLLVNPIGNGFINVFSGSANQFVVGQFTQAGIGSAPIDRTPSGFTGDPLNVWQLDSLFNNNGGGGVSIIAHAAPNLGNISNNQARPVYYGDINGTAALTPATFTGGMGTPDVLVDGGILALPPFLIAYGSDGLFLWSTINDPSTFPIANGANICSTKIVKAMSIRGGTSNPSCLLWSLDSVIQAYFVGGDVIFAFNTLSDQSSILSSSAVVEMDGIYYWPGIDRFLTFNGVLRELPNEMNLDFFYSNLNFSYANKAFGFKVPRWGEIWFCAPLFGATECNWAVVYNARENTWYDTPLPTDGRSAAAFAQTFPYPIMGSALGMNPVGQNSGTVYPLWQHELGNDQVRGTTSDAIPKSVESSTASIVGGDLTLFGNAAGSPQSVQTQMEFFEPDFLYNNSITFQTIGREYPNDQDKILNTKIVTPKPTQNFFDLNVQGRYLRWIISVNEQNGFFVTGVPLLHYKAGDPTP